MQYVTLKDVAERAGTTASTVSYVLNKKPGRYVSAEMRERVLKAADDLHYIKSSTASALKGKRRYLVSILVPQFTNQLFNRIIVAADRKLMEAGYNLLISNTDDDPEKEKDVFLRMIGQRVDGVILVPSVKGTENTDLLRQLGIPYVVLDRHLYGLDAPYARVCTDNHALGYKAAKCLLDRGHVRIGFVDWASGMPDIDLRRKGVEDAMKDAGVDPGNLLVESTALDALSGRAATERILAHDPAVTAIIYGFNLQAVGGVDHLARKGYRIPQDLSVVLIGSPAWATTGYNRFTHVDMGDFEMGRKAADLLLRQIEGESGAHDAQIIQESHLVEAGSVMDLQNSVRRNV